MKIPVLPPHVNRSVAKFSVEGNSIRFGLAAIKNVGESAMCDIIAERNANGPFRDFDDFVRRAPGINKRMLEAMIKVGCFDGMGANRNQLLLIYERTLSAAANERKQAETGQLSLFDLGGGSEMKTGMTHLPNVHEFDQTMLLSLERRRLAYLSGTPWRNMGKCFQKCPTALQNLPQQMKAGRLKREAVCVWGALLPHVQRKMTKNGNGVMAYCTLEDMTGSIELLAFPSVFTRFGSLLSEDSKVCVSGRLNVREDQSNMVLVDEVAPLTLHPAAGKLYLRFDTEDQTLRTRVLTLLQRFPGNVPVVLHNPRYKKDAACAQRHVCK